MTQLQVSHSPQTDPLPIGKPPLIGRLSEREAIVSVVTRSILENRAQVCTVIGNAGVGKSRLVTEVIADLAERVPDMRAWRGNVREETGLGSALSRILRGRFGLTESSDPGAQANEVCSQIMDLFGDRRVDEILHVVGSFLGLRFGSTVLAEAFEEDRAAREHVARAVLRRLFEVDAQRGPVMLVFEDIHLAGAEGLRLLRELCESFGAVPLVVLCTARPELSSVSHEFAHAARGRHTRVELGPLNSGESQVLARSLLSPIENVPQELVHTAVSLGGGNPLMIEQIVRIFFDQGVIREDAEGEAVIDLDKLETLSMPMNVEDAVRTRLAALTPPERQLLERAALMGSVFWLTGLVILGRTEGETPAMWGGREDLAPHYRDLLHGLAERDYVLPMPDSTIAGDEEYIFKHNLERESLQALVSREDSVKCHLVLAEWLEFRIGERGEEQLDLLARHYERGDRPLRAARCYLASADLSRARYANEKAVEHYKRGLDLLGEHDIGLRLDAHHHRGDVLSLLGRSDESQVEFRAMLALAYRLDLKGKGGAALNRLGRLFRDTGNLDEAMRHLGTALALFEAAGDERGIAATYDDIGKVHWMRGAYEPALRFMQDGLTRREAIGEPRSIALSLNNIGLVLQDSGEYRGAFDSLKRALELRRECNDLPGMVITLNNIGTIHQDRGDDAEAIHMWRQALELAREIGDRRRQAVLMLNIGEGQYRLRNLDEALKLLTEVEQLCIDLGDRLILAEARRGLGKAYYLNGNITTALHYLERALELFEQVRSRVHVAIARRSLAEVLSAHGPESAEGQRAEILFRQAIESLRELGNEVEYARTARSFAEVLEAAAEARGEPGSPEASELIAEAEAVSQKLKTSAEEPLRLGAAGRIRGTNPGFRRIDAPTGHSLREESVIVEPDVFVRVDDEDKTPPEGVKIPGLRGPA